MYEYKALVTGVYDGDTITVDIDLGFGIYKKGEKLRLYDIDAPEIKGISREEGLQSRDWLRELILDKEITVRTLKDKKGKYGRYIAKIYYKGSSVNARLVEKNLAISKHY